MFSLAGGISALSTGGTAWKATTTVRNGTYIVVDTGTGKDGKANFTKPGEVQTFTVSGNARPAAEAKSDATVTLRDYAIDMPSTISANPRQPAARAVPGVLLVRQRAQQGQGARRARDGPPGPRDRLSRVAGCAAWFGL
jgi:hypothetical protein